MAGLKEFVENVVSNRLTAYDCPEPTKIFEDPDWTWDELAKAAMGIPRTIGIVLQQAFLRAHSKSHKIRRTDIQFGISYASGAYLKQLLGAAKNGVAIPEYVSEVWKELIDRASKERKKGRPASHFLLSPKFEDVLKYLNMFFIVHLVTKGRTTKKDSSSRSLYVFDYGICTDYNLDYTIEKNVIRQQRFVYDDVIEPFFNKFFNKTTDSQFVCPNCKSVYQENQLYAAGIPISYCPKDRTDLKPLSKDASAGDFTEEEIKIVGSINMAPKKQKLKARQIADDVGCYVQKVAKFGEKLSKEELIEREKIPGEKNFIYFEKK